MIKLLNKDYNLSLMKELETLKFYIESRRKDLDNTLLLADTDIKKQILELLLREMDALDEIIRYMENRENLQELK